MTTWLSVTIVPEPVPEPREEPLTTSTVDRRSISTIRPGTGSAMSVTSAGAFLNDDFALDLLATSDEQSFDLPSYAVAAQHGL